MILDILIIRYVVKTGVHYGIDYAVYRTLPTLCHSEICALVINATNSIDSRDGPMGHNIDAMNDLSGVEGVEGVGAVNGENVRGSDVGNEQGKEVRMEEEGRREGEEEMEIEVVKEVEEEPLSCQQGWRHISTLTRVMPVSTHTHTHARTCTHTYTHTRIHTHTHILTPTHTYTQKHTHTRTYAFCFHNLILARNSSSVNCIDLTSSFYQIFIIFVFYHFVLFQ